MKQRNEPKVQSAHPNPAKSVPIAKRGSWVVKLRFVGKRLDQFLTNLDPTLSRGEIQKLITSGAVRVGDESVTKPDFRLRLGDRVERSDARLSEPKAALEKASSSAEAPVRVVAETEDFLVLDKPAGLSMHPARAGQRHTLTDWLSTHYPQIMGVGENPLRPGMVHRLDKETSGVVIVAKHDKAFRALKSLFQDRRITKEYLALVYGTLPAPSGTIDLPIGRVKGSMRRAVPGGKRAFGGELRLAETEYALHTRYPHYDLLSVKPKTGRTHQIRVHLAHLGHPVVGDRLYRFKEHRRDSLTPPFQLLHAASIRFVLSGKRYHFEAPLPPYFADTLSILALRG